MRTETTRQIVGLIFASILFLTGVICALVMIRHLNNWNTAIDHTRQVIDQLRLAVTELDEMEGFDLDQLIGKASRPSSDVSANEQLLFTRLKNVERLTRDNETQQLLIKQLQDAAAKEIQSAHEISNALRRGEGDPAIAKILWRDGHILMERFRATQRLMITNEERLLAMRQDMLRQSVYFLLIATITISAVALAALTCIFILNQKSDRKISREVALRTADLSKLNLELAQSEQNFRTLADALPQMVWVADSSANISFLNERWHRYSGIAANELKGLAWQDLVHPDDRPRMNDVWKQANQQKAIFKTECRLRGADGTYREHLVMAVPLISGDGAIVTWFGSYTDIEDQQQAKLLLQNRMDETERRFELLVENVKDYAIFMLDRQGFIRTWNAGAERSKGYKAIEIIGKHFSIFYPEEDKQAGKPAKELEIAAAVGRCEDTGWRIRKDGSRFWANVVINAVFDSRGDLKGFAKVTRDLTEQRKVEREREKRSRQLRDSRDEAIDASTMKSAFVANISHELRTPLSGILGMNELLLDTTLTEDQFELASAVQNSAKSLLSIVNDVLDLSKIEAGKLSLETVPFNLVFMIQETARTFAPAAQTKNIILKTHIDNGIPQFVCGNPERVKQVLTNLIANSVKFTESGKVTVDTEIDSSDPTFTTVRFIIQDSGIGISAQEQKLLFKPFSQADVSSTRRYGGTGLGLTICKSLVEMMGGEIGLESAKGVGSKVWFTVPFLKDGLECPLPILGQSNLRSPTSKKRTILVVEDNITLQNLMSKQLSNLGYTAHVAASARDALISLEAFEFDLVLMDCNLPEVDGFDCTRRIRQLEIGSGQHTPVIAVTAGAMPGDREKCLAAGMDDYISKPVSILALQAKIEHWLSLSKQKP